MSTDAARMNLKIRGTVQGVGFRPFVYRLATQMGLSGWVCNSTEGVQIELEGRREKLSLFVERLKSGKPPLSTIDDLQTSLLEPVGHAGFTVRESDADGEKTAFVLPDIATCPDCLKEIFDSKNRRYRYPFTNCTNCGPRYSIVESLPYDRRNTTMKIFGMCDECRAEYEDPSNRRFHAQPNACPKCGPHLELRDTAGKKQAMHDEALLQGCLAIREGRILALKGLGGFQLIVDARDDNAVARLRRRKGREEKPLALMYPSLDLIERDCELADVELGLLTSFESPIVLLRRRKENSGDPDSVSSRIAPGNPFLGVMLPYTPLHHLLMAELGFPIVATSGNLSEEPICIDEHEALERLAGIADLFLVHNRPIARQVDDSVVRAMGGRELILRNARGYAPMPVKSAEAGKSCLAVGAHLKNSIAISKGNHVFISQHIGDLETRQAYEAHKRVAGSLSSIYDFRAEEVACDLHPDYLSTKFAFELGLPVMKVQHHYAHVLSCMAENQIEPPVLGVSWDGTGFGLDGTIWGGEFLRVDDRGFTRAAHLRTFHLPGGETAVREPRRTAVGLLYEIYDEGLFSIKGCRTYATLDECEKQLLLEMLKKKINAPLTSSAGRLFDAVASMIGLCQIIRFEGQAAMQLEFAADGISTDDNYPFDIADDAAPFVVDWEPMIRALLADLQKSTEAGLIAARFHNTLVEIIVRMARRTKEKKIVLTGGCFQNRYLTERAVQRLRESGFEPHWHRYIPPNDGGIALGQLVAAGRQRR
jgi:hydrogenase maturation protein HypF